MSLAPPAVAARRARRARVDPAQFRRVLDDVSARRADLGARYAAARGRARARRDPDEARSFIVETLRRQIFPAWMGMPSGGGPTSTASLPHEPGMYISCSYFLTAALQNAGLVLESRTRFAQAPASWIEHALLPPGVPVHRYGNISPAELERRLVDDWARASTSSASTSTSASSTSATAARPSSTPATRRPAPSSTSPSSRPKPSPTPQRKGYWVSPLFRDDRLVELWLRRPGARAAAMEGAVERIAAHLTPAAAGTRVTFCRARRAHTRDELRWCGKGLGLAIALVGCATDAGSNGAGIHAPPGPPGTAAPSSPITFHAPEHGPTTSMSPAITIDERRYDRQIATAFRRSAPSIRTSAIRRCCSVSASRVRPTHRPASIRRRSRTTT